MNVDLLRRGALFVILCLAQVLVLNHIHLFSCATPFIPREAAEDLKPSIATLGVSKYTWYSFFSILLFCVVFFSLEQFSFFDPIQWLLNVGGSTLLTFLLVFVIDNVRGR